jgi:hypothetical protein
LNRGHHLIVNVGHGLFAVADSNAIFCWLLAHYFSLGQSALAFLLDLESHGESQKAKMLV